MEKLSIFIWKFSFFIEPNARENQTIENFTISRIDEEKNSFLHYFVNKNTMRPHLFLFLYYHLYYDQNLKDEKLSFSSISIPSYIHPSILTHSNLTHSFQGPTDIPIYVCTYIHPTASFIFIIIIIAFRNHI